jgi:hypothetical protein
MFEGKEGRRKNQTHKPKKRITKRNRIRIKIKAEDMNKPTNSLTEK